MLDDSRLIVNWALVEVGKKWLLQTRIEKQQQKILMFLFEKNGVFRV